jgi:holliday junction DNA helicase RuvA
MIGTLRGFVRTIRTDHLILEVGGVGYRVFVSSRTLDALRLERGEISLFIETHVREDHIHLYGFMSEAEQEMFTLLTTVQGVGNKMALAVLGVFSAVEVANIILVQDVASLTRVSGIGKRIAERLVIELKNKLPALDIPLVAMPVTAGKRAGAASAVAATQNAPSTAFLHDAISALEHLGYARMDAHRCALTAMQEGAQTLDSIIPRALALLSA